MESTLSIQRIRTSKGEYGVSGPRVSTGCSVSSLGGFVNLCIRIFLMDCRQYSPQRLCFLLVESVHTCTSLSLVTVFSAHLISGPTSQRTRVGSSPLTPKNSVICHYHTNMDTLHSQHSTCCRKEKIISMNCGVIEIDDMAEALQRRTFPVDQQVYWMIQCVGPAAPGVCENWQ